MTSIEGYTRPLRENESLFLECQLRHQLSGIKFTWQFYPDGVHEGYEIVSEDPMLRVPRLGAHDSGRYACTAVSLFGSSTSSIVVKVVPADHKADTKGDGLIYMREIGNNSYKVHVLQFAAILTVLGVFLLIVTTCCIVAYVQYEKIRAKYGEFMSFIDAQLKGKMV